MRKRTAGPRAKWMTCGKTKTNGFRSSRPHGLRWTGWKPNSSSSEGGDLVATFEEAAAYLDMIARRAEDAAEPVAIAMAEAFTDHVSKVTLRQYTHDRWSKTPAPEG